MSINNAICFSAFLVLAACNSGVKPAGTNDTGTAVTSPSTTTAGTTTGVTTGTTGTTGSTTGTTTGTTDTAPPPNTLPEVIIQSPVNGQGGLYVGADLLLEGVARDDDQPDDTLVVRWHIADQYSGAVMLDQSSSPDATGYTSDTWYGMTVGKFDVTVSVTDDQGALASDSIEIKIGY